MKLISLFLFVAFSAGFSTTNAAVVTYTDPTFNNSNWSSTKIVDTTSGAGATFTAAQFTTGGNPTFYRGVSQTFGIGGINVAHLGLGYSYLPSTQGAITTIDYCYDLIFSSNNGAVAYGLLLTQAGRSFRPSFDPASLASWTSFMRTGLTAVDFSEIVSTNGAFLDTTSHPDFSAAAPSMQFGYVTGNSRTSGGSGTTISGIDNYCVSINSVPEPSTVLTLGLSGLALLRRRRNPN